MSQTQIRDWLDRHPEALPKTLGDLARFPIAFRRVMVNVVSSDVRLQLWREHLETFLMPQSTLTESQRHFVETTIPRLPELFAAPAPNPVIVAWERDMATAFSRQEAARVFALIGPPEPPEGIPLPPDALSPSAM